MPNLLTELAAYIPRDRVEYILNDTPLPTEGVALIADISGFTPLTEALTFGLSPDHGAEELTKALDGVFTPLIAEIHAFGGSVIKFGGDALIVWYPRPAAMHRKTIVRRAVTSAWRMQQAIKMHGQVPTPIGIVTLKMKVGLTYGPVKRFNLGLPEFGFEDVLGGLTLDRMAEAEHHAEPGDIILDRATLEYLPQNTLTIAEWRDDFAAVDELLRPARPAPWPALQWPTEVEESLVKKLAPYIPSQIYQTLAAGRAQVAELKPVVSLFIQFHGIDYDADPAVAEKLQAYFAASQRVVNRYGGRLNRLITGDKGSLIHVIFGAPRAVEEQEARAVRCALDLQQACLDLRFISMQRIGLTAGRVFAGPVGSPVRHDYTTMGDSINLSARLMQNAGDDQILMEAAVRAQLGADFKIADLGKITVKGKSQPISVFAPLSVKSKLQSRQRARHQILLFGRDAEMDLLRQRLADLSHGRGGIITLVGEVGMGKTHILTALRAEAANRFTWADGICLAYGQSLSGYLFIDALHDLIELPPSASPEETSHRLTEFCRELFGPSQLNAAYPYLARFMGLPLSNEYAQRIEGLSGESLRWQLFETFQEMLRLLLRRCPVVLALDDLQWADPTSMQLVEALLPLTTSAPLLLLLSMRPERESKAWALRERVLEAPPGPPEGGGESQIPPLGGLAQDITVGSLDRSASASLIAHYAPNAPGRVVDYLVEKGGGNPLFLVEMVRTMQAQGLLSDEVDLESVALDALDLPNSVQGLLLAQIDRLTVEARHTLQMASVIGRTFLLKVLDALDAGAKDLDEQVFSLERQEYVLSDGLADLGLAYTFRHILIQESAYSTLLYERRRAYHRQVAETLENFFPTQIGEQAGLLSFHYERAGDLDKAIAYTLQAADNARLLYANEEAETLYQEALDLFEQQEETTAKPDLERRAKTYLKIAQVRSNTLDFEGAQEYYELAFELLEEVEKSKPLAEADVDGQERMMRLGVLEHGPTTLDPALAEVSDVSEIINDLFEGLVELDNELNVIPAMARRWQVYDGGRSYRFELRPNLRWSDGASLTAHDFVFAWRRNLKPETKAGLAHQLYVLRGAEEYHQGKNENPASIAIEALSDLSLEVTLNSPTGYFLYLLTHPITFPQPAHIVQKAGDDWAVPGKLICNGPFKIANWEQSREILLEKNAFYRGMAAGNLKTASLYFIPPDLDYYVDGKIDWCRVDDRSDLLKDYPDENFIAQYLQTYFLGFACSHPPFNQILLRQAFAKSINREALTAEVWANVQKPAAGGAIPPGMPGHSPEIGLQFDPEGAQHLLREAGVNSAEDLPPLTLAALPGFASTPNYLQESWQRHLGARVRIIEDVPVGEILTRLSQGTVQLVLIGWDVDYPDPDGILRILFHGNSPVNYLGWRNEQFDQLVDEAASLTDQQGRLALYHQADKILVAEDTAIAPLYYRQAYALVRPTFSLQTSGKTIRGGTFKLKNVLVAP